MAILTNGLTILALGGILLEAAGTLYVLYGDVNGRLGVRRRLAAGGIFAAALVLEYALSARFIGLASVGIITVLCWGIAGLVAGFMATAGELRFANRRDLGIFTAQFTGAALIVAVGGFLLFRDDWGPFALGVLELLGLLYGLALIDSAASQVTAPRHKGLGIALIAGGILIQIAWVYLSATHRI